jgi:predicted metal-dependent phosphoesterase TrpH
MLIDLHIHTAPRSPCSSIDPSDLIKEAERTKLDGLCLTEHQVIWTPDEVEDLAGKTGLKIFRGNEFTTNQGDILVFGFDEDIKELLTIEELHEKVKAAGGFMIAAHPYRGFKTFGIGMLQMTVEQACKRKVLDYVDAVEIGNGKLSDSENDMARQVAEKTGLIAVAGSDAHQVDELGKWVLEFENDLEDEQDLIRELRAGGYKIVKDYREKI